MSRYHEIEPWQKIAVGRHTIPEGDYCKYIVRINPITGSRSLVFRNRDNMPATYNPSLTTILMEKSDIISPASPEKKVTEKDLTKHKPYTPFNAYSPFSGNPNVEVYNRKDLRTDGITSITVKTTKGCLKFFAEEILLIIRDENRDKAVIWTQTGNRPSWVSVNLKDVTSSACSYNSHIWRNLDSE